MAAGKFDRWHNWWQKEQQIIRELILMLLMAVVTGAYFLEHVATAMEQGQRRSAEALAQQLATSASEYLSSGNLVSLNVMAQQTVVLAQVARVEIRDANDQVLASAVDNPLGSIVVHRPVKGDDQVLVGTVLVWPHQTDVAQSGKLETYFVLVVLSLLGFRLLIEMAWRRLRAEPAPLEEEETIEADLLPVLTMTQTSEAPRAWLRISIVNFEIIKQRYAADMVAEMLSGYGALLHQVAAAYGGRVQHNIGEQAAMMITGETRAEACFQALCGGTLFRALAKKLSEQRKEQERMSLEFKLLITANSDMDHSWALTSAGLPGKVHVLETEMVRYELDARLVFQGDRCLNILTDSETIRLQPIDQLASRYQKLITDQADQLKPE